VQKNDRVTEALILVADLSIEDTCGRRGYGSPALMIGFIQLLRRFRTDSRVSSGYTCCIGLPPRTYTEL
jgi:hypothetical protein